MVVLFKIIKNCLNCAMFCYKPGRQQEQKRGEGRDTNRMIMTNASQQYPFFWCILFRSSEKTDHFNRFLLNRPFQPVLANFALELYCFNREIYPILFICLTIFLLFSLSEIWVKMAVARAHSGHNGCEIV